MRKIVAKNGQHSSRNIKEIFVRLYRGEWEGGLSQKRIRAYRVGGLVKNLTIMSVHEKWMTPYYERS